MSTTVDAVEFRHFGKIPRLLKPIVVTEKIDGTNGLVYVGEDGRVLAGSRNRWLTREQDNFGFAAWVESHADELRELGTGYHYGEWYGSGIQRGYGFENGERVFALFNVDRWGDADSRPACCSVVPLLGVFDEFDSRLLQMCADALKKDGSFAAAPSSFRVPAEGLMIYHTAARTYFKYPFDPSHKGESS